MRHRFRERGLDVAAQPRRLRGRQTGMSLKGSDQFVQCLFRSKWLVGPPFRARQHHAQRIRRTLRTCPGGGVKPSMKPRILTNGWMEIGAQVKMAAFSVFHTRPKRVTLLSAHSSGFQTVPRDWSAPRVFPPPGTTFADHAELRQINCDAYERSVLARPGGCASEESGVEPHRWPQGAVRAAMSGRLAGRLRLVSTARLCVGSG